ncbi:MAG: peptidoglycan-binding protein [Verrucomicrobiota bacterium]|nr:peptidoglycan-binding protein [Verrucomicrobiota bacterium]
MKFARIVTMIIAGAGLLALAAPAEAQSRGHRGGHGGNMNRGDNHRGGFHHGGSRVNVYFGGFGYPYYGYPYYGGFYGGYYPYYGYGYGSPVRAYYTYDPRGVYEGRVVNPAQRTNDGGGKDLSMTARVQQHLARGGYYRGEIDGVAGDGTRQAIRNYERDNGLRVDGRIDDQLLATLGLG